MSKTITPMTGVIDKVSRQSGLLLRHDTRTQTVQLLLDSGVARRASHEISIAKDQSFAAGFVSFRLSLPYGVWKMEDNEEILFSRDYCPLWRKAPGSPAMPMSPETWVNFKTQEYLWRHPNEPWMDNATRLVCYDKLREFGVLGRRPMLAEIVDRLVFFDGENIDIRRAVEQLIPA